jgi:hypothetical protein
MEVADPVAGRQVLGLARRARQRRAEESVDVFRQRPDELRERPIVEKRQHPLLAFASIFAGPGRRDLRVAPNRSAKLDPCADEREAGANRHRQTQRERLDGAVRGDSAAERGSGKPAGNLLGTHARVGEEPAGGRVGGAEHMSAEVEPVIPASLRPDAPADPVLGLEDEDVAISQFPRRRKTRHSGAYDDNVIGMRGSLAGDVAAASLDHRHTQAMDRRMIKSAVATCTLGTPCRS